MKFDERELISASELNRNPSRYVALAMEGQRHVIVRDNVPVAALIGMEDLRRLDAIDAEQVLTPPAARDAPGPEDTGITIIGEDDQGVPVALPLDANHLVVGATGAGLSVALSAAIAGARPACPTHFVIVTREQRVVLQHSVAHADRITVLGGIHKLDVTATFMTDVEVLAGDRSAWLDAYGVDTIADLRNTGAAVTVPDVIFVLDRPHADVLHAFGDNLHALRQYGIYVWVFDQKLRRPGPYAAEAFDTRTALRVLTPTDSLVLINSRSAYTIPPDQPGRAYLQTTAGAATQQPIGFRFTAPYPVRGPFLEASDLSHLQSITPDGETGAPNHHEES